MKLWIAIFLISCSFVAVAKGWQCRNADLEITCSQEKCENNSSFTPMNVELSHSKMLTICAYTDCWQGQAKVQNGAHFVVATAQNLKPHNPNSANDSRVAALVIEVQDQVAVLKFDNFAQPMTCRSI